MTAPSNFEGHDGRECGEHRTLGGRAWCHDCTEYCYPLSPCRGCELPQLRNAAEALLDVIAQHGEARRDDPEVAALSDVLGRES